MDCYKNIVIVKRKIFAKLMAMPDLIYCYFHDRWTQKQVLRIMRVGGNGCDEKRMRKYLVRTLKRAYRNVPYYGTFKALSVVNENNVYDVLRQIPLLDKELIRSTGTQLYNRHANLSRQGIGHTGGTTGKPLSFYYGRASEIAHQRALYEYMTRGDIGTWIHEFGAIVSFGGTRPTEGQITNREYWVSRKPDIYGSMVFCTLFMQEQNLPCYIEKLNEIEPKVIRGYSNAILNLAKAVEKHGGLTFSPKGIYVTSEYCSKESMQFISKIFKCNVFGQYGQTEACLFAWTHANDDSYYCSPYYGYVEVLDKNGNQVKDGNLGEVVVTAFGNDIMPFVRYKTGDIVRYGGMENGIVKLDRLLGRKNEYLINRMGKKIYIVGIIDIHYLKCKDKIKQYQMQQDIIGEVIFRIVRCEDWRSQDEMEIRNLLEKINVHAVFSYEEAIPLTRAGKHVQIIQNLE